MKIVNCNMPWRSGTFQKIIDIGAAACPYFIFISRGSLTEEDRKFLEKLLPWHVETIEAQKWPGTVSEEIGIQRQKYRFNDETKKILKGSGYCLLFESSENALEDLSFLRANGTPWFISIKHEKDIYFKLDDSELKLLQEHLQSESLFIQGDDCDPEERY